MTVDHKTANALAANAQTAGSDWAAANLSVDQQHARDALTSEDIEAVMAMPEDLQQDEACRLLGVDPEKSGAFWPSRNTHFQGADTTSFVRGVLTPSDE